MTLDELRLEQQRIDAAGAKALKASLNSLVGYSLQEVECWLDEGLIIVTLNDGRSLAIETDGELKVEIFKA